MKHRKGFPTRGGAAKVLDPGGEYAWRKDGERHLFNPKTIRLLQEATRNSDYEQYKEYCATVDDQSSSAYTLRGLMEFNSERPSIELDEVEPAENILKRFATGAMSFGSISWEAHTTLAIAMNRIGSKSNSGEGGEDEVRYEKLPNGDDMCSATKQVASGRFGVNSYYLSKARELQIKMAQGAKQVKVVTYPDTRSMAGLDVCAVYTWRGTYFATPASRHLLNRGFSAADL